MKIYDPTSGSGGMLIQTRNYLIANDENAQNLSLYAQEMNQNTSRHDATRSYFQISSA